eukprot:EG_transcript_13222
MGKEEALALEEVEEDARDHLQTVLQLIREVRQARGEVMRLREERERLEQDMEHKDSIIADLESEVALGKQDQEKVATYKQRIKQYKADIEGYRQEIDELHELLNQSRAGSAHPGGAGNPNYPAELKLPPKRRPVRLGHQEPGRLGKGGGGDWAGDGHGPPDSAVAPNPRRPAAHPSDRSSQSDDDRGRYDDEDDRSSVRSRSPPTRKRSRSSSHSAPREVRRRSGSAEFVPRGKKDLSRATQPSRSVGVFGLDPKVTQDDLRAVFEEFGNIKSIQMVQNRTGKFPFAFVEFDNLDDAIDAKEKIHETRILGTIVRTDFAIGRYRKDY